MDLILEKLMGVIASFNWSSIVAIIIITLCLYYIFCFVKFCNSSYFIGISAIICLVIFFISLFDIPVVNNLSKAVLSLYPICFFILFRTELKREMWKKSQQRVSDSASTFDGTEDEIHQCIDIIIKACQRMSKGNIGALIVVVSSAFPSQIAETGVRVDANLSSEVIENIFTPNTPLHDGAMLISGNKISHAGCFLPLTQDTSIPKELGTRHRAGIGITEVTDVLSIVVSEETGVISLMRRGNMTRYADAEMMRDALLQVYGIRRLNL